jgi:hypothetical protein
METETKNSVVEAIVRLSNLVQDATVKLSKAEGLVNRKLKSFEFREAGSEVRGLLTRTNGSLKQIFRSQREGVRSLALLCGVDEKSLPQFLLRKKAIPSFVDSVALSNAPSPGSTAPELAQTTVSGSKYVTPTRARRRKKVVSLLKIHRCILGGLGKCVASERAALLADLENVARALSNLGVSVDGHAQPTEAITSARRETPPRVERADNLGSPAQIKKEASNAKGFEYLFAKIMAGPSLSEMAIASKASGGAGSHKNSYNPRTYTSTKKSSITNASLASERQLVSPQKVSNESRKTPPGSRKRRRRRRRRRQRSSPVKVYDSPSALSDASSDNDDIKKPPKKIIDRRPLPRRESDIDDACNAMLAPNVSGLCPSGSKENQLDQLSMFSNLSLTPGRENQRTESDRATASRNEGDHRAHNDLKNMGHGSNVYQSNSAAGGSPPSPKYVGVTPARLNGKKRTTGMHGVGYRDCSPSTSPAASHASAPGVPTISPFPPMSPIMQALDRSALFASHDDFSVVQNLDLLADHSPARAGHKSPQMQRSQCIKGRRVQSPTVHRNKHALSRKPRIRSPPLKNKINLKKSFSLARPSSLSDSNASTE